MAAKNSSSSGSKVEADSKDQPHREEELLEIERRRGREEELLENELQRLLIDHRGRGISVLLDTEPVLALGLDPSLRDNAEVVATSKTTSTNIKKEADSEKVQRLENDRRGKSVILEMQKSCKDNNELMVSAASLLSDHQTPELSGNFGQEADLLLRHREEAKVFMDEFVGRMARQSLEKHQEEEQQASKELEDATVTTEAISMENEKEQKDSPQGKSNESLDPSLTTVDEVALSEANSSQIKKEADSEKVHNGKKIAVVMKDNHIHYEGTMEGIDAHGNLVLSHAIETHTSWSDLNENPNSDEFSAAGSFLIRRHEDKTIICRSNIALTVPGSLLPGDPAAYAAGVYRRRYSQGVVSNVEAATSNTIKTETRLDQQVHPSQLIKCNIGKRIGVLMTNEIEFEGILEGLDNKGNLLLSSVVETHVSRPQYNCEVTADGRFILLLGRNIAMLVPGGLPADSHPHAA